MRKVLAAVAAAVILAGAPAACTDVNTCTCSSAKVAATTAIPGAVFAGGWDGHVGILGPMRMRYAVALALVKSVAEALRAPEEPRPEASPLADATPPPADGGASERG